MSYRSFEDLPVWKAAIELAVQTFAMTATGTLDRYAGLRDQIERAVVSVSNNIAEGFDRGTREEKLTFLYYALGSAGEVRSMLLLVERLPGGDGVRPELTALIPLALGTSRQLGAWIESIKNSSHPGPRYQNSSTRAVRKNSQRAQAFLEELERIKNQPRDPLPPDTATP